MSSTILIVWVTVVGICVVGAMAAACVATFKSIASLVNTWRETTRKTWWLKGRVSPFFTVNEFLYLPTIIKRLVSRGDPCSDCVWKHYSEQSQQLLCDNNVSAELKKEALVEGLNIFLRRNAVSDMHCFDSIQLSNATKELKSRNPQGETLLWLNRMLLQDAFPGAIPSKQDGSVESEIDPEDALRLAIQCRFRLAAMFLGFAIAAILVTTILLAIVPQGQEKGLASKTMSTNGSASISAAKPAGVAVPTSKP